MTKAEKVLRKALALFGRKGKYWTRHELARDASGQRCSLRSSKAEKFCALGALMFVTPKDLKARRAARNLLRKAVTLPGASAGDITSWNDWHVGSFASVRAGFRKAIRAAQK